MSSSNNLNQLLRNKPSSSMDGVTRTNTGIRSTQSGATDDTSNFHDLLQHHNYSRSRNRDDTATTSNNYDLYYMTGADHVGMHITDLLNAGAFNLIQDGGHHHHHHLSGKKSSPNNGDCENNSKNNASLFPLLSLANYYHVKNIAMFIYQIVFNMDVCIQTEIPTMTRQEQKSSNIKIEIINMHKIELPTLTQSIKMAFTFIILSSFVISTCTHIAISFVMIIYMIALILIMSMLVNFRDVYDVCPFAVKKIIDAVMKNVKTLGLEYTFQNRFHGRDQWQNATFSGTSTNTSSQKKQQRQSNGLVYQYLVDRPVPHVIALDKRRRSLQRQEYSNSTTSNSNAKWLCQNVNWNDVYHILSHPNSNSDTSSSTNSSSTNNSLSKSTLDHLIANNYCYVMVNGKDRHHQAKSSILKNKRKAHTIHRKTNNNNNVTSELIRKKAATTLNLSTRSEDASGQILEQMNGLNSVQSMDAVEVIRKKSCLRNEVMNQMQVDSLPAVSISPMNHDVQNQQVLSDRRGEFRNSIIISGDLDVVGHSGGYVRRSASNAYGSERRGSSSHAENDFLSNHSDFDLLTFDESKEYSRNDDDTANDSFGSHADVSYSSTSYNDDNNNRNKISYSDENISYDDERKKKRDMKKWLDVGAKIGMRILESEKLHQAITKSQMPPNLSSSYSGAEEDNECDAQQRNGETESMINNSPTHVAKPFHSMWTSPNIPENQSYDDVSSEEEDGCSYSEVGDRSDDEIDFDDVDNHLNNMSHLSEEMPLLPPLSKRVCSLNASLLSTIKPKKKSLKPLRNVYDRGASLPSSPTKSKIVSSRSSVTNFSSSMLSADTNQMINQFDANQYLPPSMAIHHDSINDDFSQKSTSDVMMKKKIELGRLTVNTDLLVCDFQPKKSYKESTRSRNRRRLPLLPGVRMVVPIFPATSRSKKGKAVQSRNYYQFATVASSKRINTEASKRNDFKDDLTDCLSITVLLDKSFLRSGKFAEMTMRIHDAQRHMPRHSKFPIGACVATTFGVGVLVGWRAEDDCHIIRALWQKRGNGAAHAYLNRTALHEIVEAGVGFKVGTTFGNGKVVAYVGAGRTFTSGKYIVLVKKGEGRMNRIQMELDRSDIKTCHSSKFIPVVEQIKEAAKYQMQVDKYESAKLQRILEDESLLMNQTWRVFSEGFELFLSSFIKAAEEDDNIDSEIHNFLSSAITFLEDFDLGNGKEGGLTFSSPEFVHSISESTTLNLRGTGMWIVDDLLGDVPQDTNVNRKSDDNGEFGVESYKKVYAALNTAARTIAIAQSSCTERPNLKMALAITHEFLILIHNVIKVQQVNMSKASVEAWQKTLMEFSDVFGSINTRLQSIGNGIIQRLQEHGKVAKVRAICFADTLISDDLLMEYLEIGDVRKCLQRVEIAAVSANVMDAESCQQYHKIGLTLYNTLAPRNDKNQEAAFRSGKKITFVAKLLKILATPGRSMLKLLMSNEVLEIIERVFVRIFEKENDASLTLNIYSWNFRTLRHLRILNNMAISGGLWAPVLDAADEEFTWAVSRAPAATRDYIVPISKLFSLGVARFHQLYHSEDNISTDWLDFLKEEEAVKIIQDVDAALMLSLKNFCKDVKEMMQVLPYYSSIDEDILRLIDEVDLKKELKEVGEAIVDTDKFPQYIREKSASAVSKFLDYLPKMSIPIERREIGEDWVVTCRGRNGKDLTLSKVNIEKENLLCQVLGGENVLLPVIEGCKIETKLSMSSLVQDSSLTTDEEGNVEVSILDHVAELIRNAQNHGCWKVGTRGIVQSESPLIARSSLQGLPLSEVLLCAIDLWENLEIDDDELLEIAIRDVSHKIQLQKYNSNNIDETVITDHSWPKDSEQIRSKHKQFTQRETPGVDACRSSSSDFSEKRFNPKKDPTVLYLSLSELTCCLDDFTYRIEPAKATSMFDPVFEGVGTLSVKNASIKIRIECRKERIKKLNEEVTVPVLQLQDLDIGLEQVNFRFKETGADWLLNKIISNFTKGITQVVRDNMKEQISLSINEVLHNLNSYIEVNPDLMLKILGITLDDLEENVAWV